MMKFAANKLIALPAQLVGVILLGLSATPTIAAERSGENVITCQITGQDREASISIVGTNVTYRYGPPQQQPELTLTSALADIDYRRKSGAGDTIDEIVTFANGDTTYRFAFGFHDGFKPDPSALRPFGHLTISRANRVLAQLPCRPDTIERVHDRMLAHMREIGRERDSDNLSFSNYEIQYPAPARQSPPCEADFNVDTCWSRGVSAARGGDLPGALEHHEMSCDAGLITAGCYEAGKLYLHNRQLRNYTRAQDRLTRVCDGNDSGQGPYACKYLGWMHLTGVGTKRDLDMAWSALSRACFLQNNDLLIDPEGCHFLAQTVLEARDLSPSHAAMADYLAYVSLAQACTDDAKTVCDEARALYRRELAREAAWITLCDRDVDRQGVIESCAQLTEVNEDYDAAMSMRRQNLSIFLSLLDRLN